ncbi:MAG: arrestin family protein [Polyangiaceae bacterium]
MRSRPDVEIRIPKIAHPGDTVPIDIVIEPRSETPVDFIDLRFFAEEVTALDWNGARVQSRRTIVERKERLVEATTLVPGTLQHRVTVRLPSDAPPSYMGVRDTISYHVSIHVSIPWWPDLHESAELLVSPPPGPREKPVPATKTGRRADGAVIDLSVSDTAFAPGDEIAGAFAVGDLPRRDALGVELSLIAVEEVAFEHATLRAERTRYLVPTVLRAPRMGVEVPFRFRVPEDAIPSFETMLCVLRWHVQAAIRRDFSDVAAAAIPIKIRRFSARAGESADHPRIGAQKWRSLWRDVGEQTGLTLVRDQLALTGQRGDITLRVAREDVDEIPTLVATLEYPSLRLDLHVEKAALMLRETPAEARLGRGHQIKSRVPAQADAFFTRRLVESLRRFGELALADDRAVVRAVGSGLEPKILTDFVANALSLAKALTEAIDRIPPPIEMTEALSAWQSFAVATGGTLSIGGMAVTSAEVDGAVFDVVTLFSEDGVPNRTAVCLKLDPPLDRAYDLREPDPWAPPGARELCQSLRAEAAGLTIEEHQIRLSLSGITPDPSDLRPRMGQMILLSRRLRGERAPGPYR